jgi:ssDNA-binding Zn-finger/Zn-ribbon topoisomerase 1
MSDADLASVRAGDQTFVRRCRMAATGVIRLGAVWVTWRAAESVLGIVVQSNLFGTFGTPRIDPFYLVLVGLWIGSGIALWFAAGWLARKAFRMPPGRNQCPKCKYPIADIESDTCPECGTRVR